MRVLKVSWYNFGQKQRNLLFQFVCAPVRGKGVFISLLFDFPKCYNRYKILIIVFEDCRDLILQIENHWFDHSIFQFLRKQGVFLKHNRANWSVGRTHSWEVKGPCSRIPLHDWLRHSSASWVTLGKLPNILSPRFLICKWVVMRTK